MAKTFQPEAGDDRNSAVDIARLEAMAVHVLTPQQDAERTRYPADQAPGVYRLTAARLGEVALPPPRYIAGHYLG